MLNLAAKPRSRALSPFIRSFHYHEGALAPAVERILPTGQAHLLINLDEDEFRMYSGANCEKIHRFGGAVLAGPQGGFVGMDTREQHRLVAVEFQLGGLAAFLPMPASEVGNQVVELRDVWGQAGSLLRERLCEARTPSEKFRVLESALAEGMARPQDPAIAAAVSMLDRGAGVAETRERLGLLPKTFVRRFSERVGLAPKRLARVRRLQRVVASVRNQPKTDWCAVAAEHGYTDQAHLIHEFRELAGMTPTGYRPSSARRRNHVPVAAPAA